MPEKASERTGDLRKTTSAATIASVVCALSGTAIGFSGESAAVVMIGSMVSAVVVLAISRRAIALSWVLLLAAAFDNVSLGGPLSIGRVSGMLAVAGLVLYASHPDSRLNFTFNRTQLLVVGFVCWAILSGFWASNRLLYFQELQTVISVSLAFYLAFFTIADLPSARWLLANMWLLEALASIGAIVSQRVAGHQTVTLPSIGRLAGGLGDPNELALYLVAMFPTTVVSLRTAKRTGKKLIISIVLLVAAAAIVLSGSRGGALAFLTAVLVLAFSERENQTVRIVLVGAAVVASTLAMQQAIEVHGLDLASGPRLLWKSLLEREGRVTLWAIAARVTHDRPWLGVGLGNFPNPDIFFDAQTAIQSLLYRKFYEPNVTHNAFLQISAELGMPGAFAFGAIIISTLRNIRVAIDRNRQSDPDLANWLQALRASLLSIVVALSFLSEQYSKILWLLLGLCGSISRLAGETQRPST